MRLDLENLPSDIALLHHLVRDMATVVETRDDEIERLQRLIKQLQRRQFGRRSERLDPDQLALGLEDLDADVGRTEAHQAPPPASDEEPEPRAARSWSGRGPDRAREGAFPRGVRTQPGRKEVR